MANIKPPQDAITVQEGLLAYKETNWYNLYAQDGYHFYIPQNNIDYETNEMLPIEEITYYEFLLSGYKTVEEINGNVISVKKPTEINETEK
jgi:hypothetical protein